MLQENKVPLLLPFISDTVSAVIQRCIQRAGLTDDVFLVDIPSDNIKRRLVRNRLYDRACCTENCVTCPYGRAGDCVQGGVIYQLQCSICGEFYIGETGRPLGIRVKEHLVGKRKLAPLTPLGRHRMEKHHCNDFEFK